MTRAADRTLFAGIGALFVIACLHLGARIAGHHVLEITTKE